VRAIGAAVAVGAASIGDVGSTAGVRAIGAAAAVGSASMGAVGATGGVKAMGARAGGVRAFALGNASMGAGLGARGARSASSPPSIGSPAPASAHGSTKGGAATGAVGAPFSSVAGSAKGVRGTANTEPCAGGSAVDICIELPAEAARSAGACSLGVGSKSIAALPARARAAQQSGSLRWRNLSQLAYRKILASVERPRDVISLSLGLSRL